MRRRMVAIGLVVVAGTVGVGVAASTERSDPALPEACALPGQVLCGGAGDPSCTQYGAVCDTQNFVCVCVGIDGGTDLGGADLAGADLAGADLAPSDGGGGSTAGTPPATGGGMSSPARSGCSFAPGAP